MQIRQVTIEGFRGIRSFDWRPDSAVSCLIGPGDSTKTTVLDAIEYALSARWTVTITDSDFHGGRFRAPISITVTVGQLPAVLLQEDKFGLDLRGWNPESGLRDEPEGADEAVLTVRFSVDDSLEPTWLVINDRRPEGRVISAKDREALGLVRLGGDIDRHLSWTRGSVLSRQTDKVTEVGRVLAEAHREARDVVRRASLAKLDAVAKRAKQMAEQLGVRAPGEFHPALEAMLTLGGMGPLSLHADEIPVRALGLGSRRLVALALQWMAVKEGAILLVDEVEHALEPHRLRHLLRVLREAPREGQGQVLLTTHSSVAIEELSADELLCVRSENGITIVKRVSPDLQALVRDEPEAFLAHKVLVCEGKTELGLCRGLMSFWAEMHEGLPFAHTGTALAVGQGSLSAKRAVQLARLGYKTALFADSDKPLDPDAAALERDGVTVIQWSGNLATEERVALDLPWSSLQGLLDAMIEVRSEESALSAIGGALPGGRAPANASLDSWRSRGLWEQDIRRALGQAAKQAKALKRVDLGEQLASVVGPALPAIAESDLAVKLAQVAAWCYGD